LLSIQPGVQKDSKTLLQEFLQGRRLALPVYEVTDIQGDAHDQTFTVKCTVDGMSAVIASGSSRRKAEQDCAQLVLERLKNES
jgi:ribonuclease-3